MLNQLKEEIADLVQRRLNAGADRIVIFIDDLDRIKPAIAVEILETIKRFVDWPGCVFVFVLALDYGVVMATATSLNGLVSISFCAQQRSGSACRAR